MKHTTRVAIVTGAGRGIGKAIARRFLDEGMIVVAAEINAEGGRETERQLSKYGEITFIKTDVGREASVRKMIQRTIRTFGRIDVLVNNAAFMSFKPMMETSLADWNKSVQTNLTGPFLLAKHCSPYLRKVNGCIINIASIRALMSDRHQESYGATKGGLLALTHALALSLGPQVRVNAISPGWIDTTLWQASSSTYKLKLRPIDHSQHPAGRAGKPEDIAAMATFLANPRHDFITGANFVVDGGMMKKMAYLD